MLNSIYTTTRYLLTRFQCECDQQVVIIRLQVNVLQFYEKSLIRYLNITKKTQHAILLKLPFTLNDYMLTFLAKNPLSSFIYHRIILMHNRIGTIC